MHDILYLWCRTCGERLTHRHTPWCSDCHLNLAYRAMPLLLGALLMQRPLIPQRVPAAAHFGRYLRRGYDSENALNWE